MVFHRIKRQKGKKINYLVKNFKFKGKIYQVQKYLGLGNLKKVDIENAKLKYNDWFLKMIMLKKATLSAASFKSDILSKDQIIKFETIRYVFKEYMRNLHPNEIEILDRDFNIKYIHSTTATEGNTCTLAEVTHILDNSLSPKGRSLREIYEVRNFEDVLRFRKKYSGDLSKKFVLGLHELIMKDIDLYTIGAFRRIEVDIRGSETKPIPAIFIDDEINKLLEWYHTNLKKTHPVELATRFHVRFEEIHPFTDGNGRVGREIFNFTMTRMGYPPLNFNVTRRDEYINGLEKAINGDLRPIINYVLTQYLEQIKFRLGSNSLIDIFKS